MSLGIKRGTLVRHKKYGYCLIGALVIIELVYMILLIIKDWRKILNQKI
jgi:hypothetical protein